MKQNDNFFYLDHICVSDGDAVFSIKLFTHDTDPEVYISAYLYGVYLEIEKEKWNIPHCVSDSGIEACVNYKTIFANADRAGSLKLYVRCRIGNSFIDHPVIISNLRRLGLLEFGHWNVVRAIAVSPYEFRLTKESRLLASDTLLSAEKEITCKDICITDEKDLLFTLSIRQDLWREKIKSDDEVTFCLVLKDTGFKNEIVFETISVSERTFPLRLPKEDFYFLDEYVYADCVRFQWFGKLCDDALRKIADGRPDAAKDLKTPFQSGWLGEKNGHMPLDLISQMSGTSIFSDKAGMLFLEKYEPYEFCYHGFVYLDGVTTFYFRQGQASYTICPEAFVMKKVNTEIEYVFPVKSETDENASDLICVAVDLSDLKETFRQGIYQFYVQVADGYIKETHPLRIACDQLIAENAFLIGETPFLIVGDSYYDVLFYNDTSRNLKAKIIPKRLQACMTYSGIREDEYIFSARIKIEPNFKVPTKVWFENSHAELCDVCFTIEEETDTEARICGQCSLLDMLEFGGGEYINLCLGYHCSSERVRFQNNMNGVIAKKRDPHAFRSLVTLADETMILVSGNNLTGDYALKVSTDLEVFQLEEIRRKNNTLCLTAQKRNDCNIEIFDLLEVFLEDMAGGGKISPEKIQNDNETFSFHTEIDLTELPAGEYQLLCKFSNGNKACRSSILAAQCLPENFILNEDDPRKAKRIRTGSRD